MERRTGVRGVRGTTPIHGTNAGRFITQLHNGKHRGSNQTPLAPAELAFDVTVYLVLNDFGPLGRAYVETDEAQADEATIVENILNGQYSQPLRVVAFNAAEGWARDVTEDVARAALSKVQSKRRQIAEVAQEFLERALGVEAKAPLRYAAISAYEMVVSKV